MEVLQKTRNIIFAIALSINCWSAYAQSNYQVVFEQANEQYIQGNYTKAIEIYEGILTNNIHAGELYFNLGNAYYKNHQIGMAILHYERAIRLLPNDEDVKANLGLANLKIKDKMEEKAELLSFSSLLNNIALSMTEKAWAWLCVSLLITSLILYALYMFSHRIIMQKTYFYSASIAVFISVIVFFMAKHNYNIITKNTEAIIISASVSVMSEPTSTSTKLFILHEGSKINITEESSDFYKLTLINGNVGWVNRNDVIKI